MFANKQNLRAVVLIIFIVVAGVWIYISRGSEQPAQDSAMVKADQGSPSEMTVNFHQLATGNNFGDILKLSMPAIDEANRKMYVVGTKTTYVGVIDLDTDTLVETFDIGVPGGFLIFNNKLYSFAPDFQRCWMIDTVQKKAQDVSFETCVAPPRDAKKWQDYSFTATGFQGNPNGRAGFPVDWRQDLNAAYGVIEIHDSADKKLGEIIHGPDALYFSIDSVTGKLYTVNTGDGSINVFDLNKLKSTNYCENNSCWIKDIDVGNSADQVIVDSAGNIYVRNRLGGSVIYKYNAATKEIAVIDNENSLSKGGAMRSAGGWQGGGIGMWPMDIVLSKDEARLFVLGHYGALIDVVDTTSGNVVSKIKFHPQYVSFLPRTDAISSMVLDKSRDRIFAAFPESGIIGVADGSTAKATGAIDLTKYGFNKADPLNAGPGLINMAVNEKENRLYVYLYNAKKILTFNADTLKKENEASVTLVDRKIYAMFSNDEKGLIYMNNKVIDAKTLKIIDTFSRGYVVAFNNDKDAVYLAAPFNRGPAKRQEKVFELVNGEYTKEWALDIIPSIPSTFYFDFPNNSFYVAYFTSGVVKKYSLSGGAVPSAVDLVPPSGGEPGLPGAGKCGNGICDAAEKRVGLCPEDCR